MARGQDADPQDVRVPALLAALGLLAAAPAASAERTERYVLTGRVLTIDVNSTVLTIRVASANRAARRFLGQKVRFHIALADVEVMDRTGDDVGLPEDVQASDRVRISADLNRRSRQPFEAVRVVDLTAPPR